MTKNKQETETQYRLRLAKEIKSKLLSYPIDLEFQKHIECLLEVNVIAEKVPGLLDPGKFLTKEEQEVLHTSFEDMVKARRKAEFNAQNILLD